MKKFNSLAALINKARREKGITQVKLSKIINYKNGQFISNVERGLCSLPAKHVNVTAEVLGLTPTQIVEGMVDDYRNKIQRVVFKS
jgi:ribosome-binding protein aMBF1 (putative translation factor)